MVGVDESGNQWILETDTTRRAAGCNSIDTVIGDDVSENLRPLHVDESDPAPRVAQCDVAAALRQSLLADDIQAEKKICCAGRKHAVATVAADRVRLQSDRVAADNGDA